MREFMTEQKIEPSKVTKPIQLLAAWLVGLTLINGSFLGAAIALGATPWLQSVLVIAAVVNVPVFIVAIFLLQTKYRPEMQEDSFYATYLDKKTQRMVSIAQVRREDIRDQEVVSDVRALSQLLPQDGTGMTPEKLIARRRYAISMNDYFPQFDILRNELRKSGYRVKDIFGSTNDPPTDAPSAFIISIVDYVEIEFVRELLRILLKYDFRGIKFTPRDDIDDSEIYLGSYDFERGYATITEELKTLIDDGFEKVDIDHYCQKNWTT
jgi:hypothetical protein